MKETTKELLEGLAGDLGYKLVKRDKPSIPPMLPPNMKDYSKLSSEMLVQELKVLEDKIVKFKARNDRLKICTTTFMEDQQPDHTKVVFDGSRFDASKLVVTDITLTKYANLKNHIESLLKEMLEKEMTNKFMELNPEFKGKIDNITIKTTPTGEALFVIVSEETVTKATTEESQGSKDLAGVPNDVTESEATKADEEWALKEEAKKKAEEAAKAKAMAESEKINLARRGRPPKKVGRLDL